MLFCILQNPSKFAWFLNWKNFKRFNIWTEKPIKWLKITLLQPKSAKMKKNYLRCYTKCLLLKTKKWSFCKFYDTKCFSSISKPGKERLVISRKNIFMDFLQICETCRQPRRGGVDLTHGSYLQQKRPKFVVTFQKFKVLILCCKFFGSIQLWENLVMLLGSHKKLQNVKIYARRATFA